MMASMRNGSGDEYFILFNSYGAAANEFCDSIIQEVHEWLNGQLAKPKTAILGVESLLIEWTGREHIMHVMRFL
jgi:hypothetical protein